MRPGVFYSAMISLHSTDADYLPIFIILSSIVWKGSVCQHQAHNHKIRKPDIRACGDKDNMKMFRQMTWSWVQTSRQGHHCLPEQCLAALVPSQFTSWRCLATLWDHMKASESSIVPVALWCLGAHQIWQVKSVQCRFCYRLQWSVTSLHGIHLTWHHYTAWLCVCMQIWQHAGSWAKRLFWQALSHCTDHATIDMQILWQCQALWTTMPSVYRPIANLHLQYAQVS